MASNPGSIYLNPWHFTVSISDGCHQIWYIFYIITCSKLFDFNGNYLSVSVLGISEGLFFKYYHDYYLLLKSHKFIILLHIFVIEYLQLIIFMLTYISPCTKPPTSKQKYLVTMLDISRLHTFFSDVWNNLQSLKTKNINPDIFLQKHQ